MPALVGARARSKYRNGADWDLAGQGKGNPVQKHRSLLVVFAHKDFVYGLVRATGRGQHFPRPVARGRSPGKLARKAIPRGRPRGCQEEAQAISSHAI